MLDLLDAERHGRDRPVLTLGRETFDRGGLDALVREVAALIETPHKALVLCLGDRDLSTVVTYLAALRAGQTAGFLPAPETPEALLAAYDPEFVVPAGPDVDDLTRLGYTPVAGPVRLLRRPPRPPRPSEPPIRPETAVLLATSGSTGSPKAVRLSYDAVTGNADAIVEALGITAADRAVTTLPIRHAYGLSVLNTHLRAGGSLVLSDLPPTSLPLWDLLVRSGSTSFAAVPTTYRALGRAHLKALERSAVTTMTQAGGRLPDELALRWHTRMAERGGRFFVMYGQTEATARMSCLDHADLPARLGSAGVAMPGGQLTVDPVPDRPGEGEICYRGPGVMLGYARCRADLALPPGPDVLRTGDLGRIEDGFLYVTGRLKRIAKMLGRRVSLDELERLADPAAVVAPADDHVQLVVDRAPESVEPQRRRIVALLGVPDRNVTVRGVDALPRTHSGKTDYAALAAASTSGVS